MTREEIKLVRRRVLKRKIRKGTCQACGAPHVERYRLGLHDICERCVERMLAEKEREAKSDKRKDRIS